MDRFSAICLLLYLRCCWIVLHHHNLLFEDIYQSSWTHLSPFLPAFSMSEQMRDNVHKNWNKILLPMPFGYCELHSRLYRFLRELCGRRMNITRHKKVYKKEKTQNKLQNNCICILYNVRPCFSWQLVWYTADDLVWAQDSTGLTEGLTPGSNNRKVETLSPTIFVRTELRRRPVFHAAFGNKSLK